MCVCACKTSISSAGVASSSARLRVCLRVSAVHVSALRVRVSVCVGSAANGDSPAPVCRASACLCSACLRLRGCLGRVRRCACRVVCRVLRPLRTPGRPRAGAVARVPFGRCHIHALRATWTSASRFEVRGRRVCLWLRPLYCLSLCVFYVCLLTY